MTDEDVERLMQFEGIVKTVWKSKRQSRMQDYSLPYKRSSAVFIIIPCYSFPTKSRLSTHSGHWARFRYPPPNPMPWVKIWKNEVSNSSELQFATPTYKLQVLSTIIWQTAFAGKSHNRIINSADTIITFYRKPQYVFSYLFFSRKIATIWQPGLNSRL